MSQTASDQNLLFGIVALQMDFISRDELISAMHAWALEKDKPLGMILLGQGALADDERCLLDSLVHMHLKRHDDDVGRSLSSLSPVGWLKWDLPQVADAELDASLRRLVDTLNGPDATESFAAGVLSTAGGRFRILRSHARGGQGEVFVARDTELNREVALKQIQARYADQPESRSRFLLEAEVTGSLEHPGVIPVYGLGYFDDGRPFYAMRFIRGDSLKDAIAQFHQAEGPGRDPGERSLALRRLLRRFVDGCNALAYAHSRGVLHRDLKPGNVMLGPYGETLVVDWGLAKAAGHRDGSSETDERTLRPKAAGGSTPTMTGEVIGTPAYMSPEQARGELDRLSPRSDVYSLGATLYSLLTGRPPFENDDVVEMLRAVRQGKFPPPRQLDPSIDPALEAVCKRAMALEPEDRYATCRELIDDVERWMADEAVLAWRDPLSRRARRWMRRNRAAVTGAAAALIAGVFGLAAAAVVQARSNSALASANDKTRTALAETRLEKANAEESLAQSEAVRNFLVEAFRSPDPEGDGKDIKVAAVLDRAAQRLDKEFTGSPATRGALLSALGETYVGLGVTDKAAHLLDRAYAVRKDALGIDQPDTIHTRIVTLGLLASDAGRTAEAIKLGEEMLGLAEAKLGADHRDTLVCRTHLGSSYIHAGRLPEAIRMLEDGLARCEARLGPEDIDTLGARNALAFGFVAVGRIAEAIRLFEAVLRTLESQNGVGSPSTLVCRDNLGMAYTRAERAAEAIGLGKVTLRIYESKFGAEHRHTLICRNNLANAYLRSGQYKEAIVLHEENAKILESTLGPNHPHTLSNRRNLAADYMGVGRVAEAIGILEAAQKQMSLNLPPDHPNMLFNGFSLARAYWTAGRNREAIELYETTLASRRLKLGADHPDTLMTCFGLAFAYQSSDRWKDAEVLWRDMLARRRRTVEPSSPLLALDLSGLGRNLLQQEKWLEAESVLRECLPIFEKTMPNDQRRFAVMSLLGGALMGQQRYAEAEPLVVKGYKEMKVHEANIHAGAGTPLLVEACRVVALYDAWGKPEKSSEWKKKLGLSDLPVQLFANP
jgi:eukaryotic-like serine/threonine-protein kinase